MLAGKFERLRRGWGRWGVLLGFGQRYHDAWEPSEFNHDGPEHDGREYFARLRGELAGRGAYLAKSRGHVWTLESNHPAGRGFFVPKSGA